jgi:glycosyltransferase involved in cell wall biosynthesis
MSSKNVGLFCSLFKGKDFIEGYLENILNQTYFKKTTFYILDCDSPDNERDLILKYTSEYENIKYKRLSKDPGLYAAWNLCIDWVDEPFIGNWNVDDRKTPWSTEVLMNPLLGDENLDLVYGKTLISNIANETWDKNSAKYIYPFLPHTFENLLKNNSPHCMPIWRKDLHQRFGYFNENYMTASDTDMWLRACKGGANMKLVDSIVGLYYENPKGRSTNPETLKKMVEEVFAVRDLYRK